MKIWLDDQRTAPNGWIHIHNIEEVERIVEIMIAKKDLTIDEISYDFHLSHPKSGLDVMKVFSEECIKNKTSRFWAKTIHYHSTDPKGIKIMKEYARKFESEVLPNL